MTARVLLALPPGGDAPAWAAFDAPFYAARAGLTGDTATLLAHYLDQGQRSGLSPNPLFDEAHYRRTQPDAARDIETGACDSGFDHFARGAYADLRSPHWLFDAHEYLRRYPGLDAGTLREAKIWGLYDHYLKHGDAEGRPSTPFYDPAPPGFAAFVSAPADRRVSFWFDPAWYLARYPEIADAIRAGRHTCALHHYLTNDQPTAFDPLPDFTEAYYLACNPDIAEAVRAGHLRNGYAHFVAAGAREHRSPHAAIDLRHYVSHYPDVREALERGDIPDPFTHLQRIGRAENRHTNPAARADVPDETQTKALFRARAATLATAIARAGLDLACDGEPDLSVILVLHNQFALTLQTLATLRASTRLKLEIILVDSGSDDETRFIEAYVRGAILLRFDANIGFVRGCNAGLLQATAPAVLFLNTDVVVHPGAPDAALAALARPGTGAVGARIVRTHGLLQEAGCCVRADGTTFGAYRDLPATAPEAAHARDVDYCSGAFLMASRALLEDLGGFDDAYAPAYYEDADLCARIAARGLRVRYEPACLIEHLEYGSAPADLAVHHRIDAARAVFRERHAPFLATRDGISDAALIDSTGHGPRVLFIEDQIPLRRLGSGFVRSNDILAAMADLGCRVTVLPMHPYAGDPAALAELPPGIARLPGADAGHLAPLLADRAFDLAWVARTHNFARTAAALRPWRDADPTRRVILDTEAVASVRDAARDPALDLGAALATEFRDAALADTVVATTPADAATLARTTRPVRVLGHVRTPDPAPNPFEARDGMLFVGAIHELDSPNYDSLVWFIDEVLPRIEATLGWRTRLTVAGHVAPGVSLARFDHHPRVTLRGPLPDLTPLYAQARVFVAPTRYAGGAPYKIHEAASRGLPVVATSLLAAQLGWHDGAELLAAPATDPAAFASAVLRAHEDPALWSALRDTALARIARENDPRAYRATLAEILGLEHPAAPSPPLPLAGEGQGEGP